ncbi:MAG: RdgB/HAM1 family non-canonical purine NTP pyrophosphatase [Actinomycetota bacterium]
MTELPKRIVLATRNPHKIEEITRICGDWAVEWLSDREIPAVEETGSTYLENAMLKAREVARATGEAALADDSGIEVDALGGAPGPRSARYAGDQASDEKNLRALLRATAGVPTGGRTARYRAVAVLAWPGGREVHAEATCEGLLAAKPRGVGGFGYDPVFVPLGDERTMAELAPEEKDRVSHRGRALRALRALLR